MGALGIIVAWVAVYLHVRDDGMLTSSVFGYAALAIPGAFPFLLISFGRPRRPFVSLIVCLLLLSLNTYAYVLVFARMDRSGFAGLNALGAMMYSWVIWGVGMVVDNWRRERTPRLASPPRPDPVDTDRN